MTALIENWVESLYNRGLQVVGVEDNNGQGASYLFIKFPHTYKTAKELARFLQMEANTPETFMLNVLPDGDNWEEAKYEVYYKDELKDKGEAGDILSLRVLIGSTEAYYSNIAPSDEHNQDMLEESDYIGMADEEESDWLGGEEQRIDWRTWVDLQTQVYPEGIDYTTVVPEWVVEIKGKGRFLYGFVGKEGITEHDFDKAMKFVTRKRADEYIARVYPDTVDPIRSKARKVYYYEGALWAWPIG